MFVNISPSVFFH